MVDLNKCLYCGRATQNGNPYCPGGGPTRERSNTGEDGMTKSYCYNDHITIMRLDENLGMTPDATTTTYKLWQEEIKGWYKSLPLQYDRGVEPLPSGGKQPKASLPGIEDDEEPTSSSDKEPTYDEPLMANGAL